MKRITIISTERFDLVSVGNGLHYELFDNDVEESTVFVGDDAVRFREELDAFEAAQPETSYEVFLHREMYG
jgi:hypothetical protein